MNWPPKGWHNKKLSSFDPLASTLPFFLFLFLQFSKHKRHKFVERFCSCSLFSFGIKLLCRSDSYVLKISKKTFDEHITFGFMWFIFAMFMRFQALDC